MRKRGRLAKEQDFLGCTLDEPVKEVLEAFPLEIATVAWVHFKYWTEALRDHTSSCTVEDLVVANRACII